MGSQARTARATTTIPAVVALAASLILATAVLTAPATTWYPWVLTAATACGALFPAVIDARTHTLPNRYTGPLALAAAIQVVAFTIRSADPWQLLWAALAAVVTFLLFSLLAIRDYVGFGDVKYAAALALLATILAGLAAVYLMPVAVLLGAAGRGIRYLLGHRTHKQALGPYILAATVLLMVYGVLATTW